MAENLSAVSFSIYNYIFSQECLAQYKLTEPCERLQVTQIVLTGCTLLMGQFAYDCTRG